LAGKRGAETGSIFIFSLSSSPIGKEQTREAGKVLTKKEEEQDDKERRIEGRKKENWS